MGGYVPPGYQPTGQPAPFGSGGPPPITNQPTAAEGKHSKRFIFHVAGRPYMTSCVSCLFYPLLVDILRHKIITPIYDASDS